MLNIRSIPPCACAALLLLGCGDAGGGEGGSTGQVTTVSPTATEAAGTSTGASNPTTGGASGTTAGEITTGPTPTTGSGPTTDEPATGSTVDPDTTTPGETSSASSSGGIDQCAGTTVVPTPVPLDIYVMLDKSGSMLEKTGKMGQGIPKWDAVTGALEAFFNDPESAGIGVGLQYFPIIDPQAPDSCKSQADCGMFGPCFLKVCQGDTGIVCTSNNQCGNAGPCTNLGQCANDAATFCLPIGAQCPGNKGQCVQVTTSVCLAVDSCDSADYADPAEPIDVLPDAAPALIASMTGTAPEGATPTGPALQGAIDYASQWAAANPTHKVVALLATDGLPTECTPLDNDGLAQIAAAGLAGDPSVPTFVIGVFAGMDAAAKATIDAIAAAGGTGTGFYVDAQQNVDQAFLDALNAIRGAKLACEYIIPEPPPNEMLDYQKVNVLHTPDGQNMPVPVPYVGSADLCDPALGGWYYDVDPMMGGVPTKIIMCPATCDSFGLGGVVDLQLGCETVVPG